MGDFNLKIVLDYKIFEYMRINVVKKEEELGYLDFLVFIYSFRDNERYFSV